jgi:DNA-directed RNA polymerase subunit alpha
LVARRITTAPTTAAAAAPAAGSDALGKSVQDMELSVRSRKALQRLNINSLAELTSRTEDELLGCKNFGQTSLNEIKQQLATFGLGLRKLEE